MSYFCTKISTIMLCKATQISPKIGYQCTAFILQ